jgi:hypothetical protein
MLIKAFGRTGSGNYGFVEKSEKRYKNVCKIPWLRGLTVGPEGGID